MTNSNPRKGQAQIGGPKPFKFLTCWWLRPDFRVVIQNLWSSAINSVSGSDRMAKVIL
jgi:hypothetical protein